MVKKVITNLDSSKASGPGCIPVVVLKNCEPELSYIIAKLFNKCLKESCFLDCWKVSLVVPVFKNVGERSTAKNYCPVSLLWICRTVGPSLAASLESLAHRRNVASLSLFYRYYFGRCSSELAQLVPLPYSRGRPTCYSDRLHDFSVTIPRCYKDVYVTSFFPHTVRLWNSLPIE